MERFLWIYLTAYYFRNKNSIIDVRLRWSKIIAIITTSSVSCFNLDFKNIIISSCYRTAPSAIWEIFSEFLIFCNLLHKPLGKWNNSKIREMRKIFVNIARCNNYCAITTLSLNDCWNQMYNKLCYLLLVSSLLNI